VAVQLPEDVEARRASAASDPAPSPAPRAPRRIRWTAVAVLVVGLVLTSALAAAAWSVHGGNEQRLLDQRVREAGALLTVALPSIQTPLGSAAVLAEATNADPASFEKLMRPMVGPKGPFVTASIWRADGSELQPILRIGTRSDLTEQSPDVIRAFLARSAGTPRISVLDLLDRDQPRLGYTMVAPDGPIRYVAYAETPLPANRLSAVPTDSAFADLDYAVYLGKKASDAHLLSATTRKVPLRGRTADDTVAFGDTFLHIVVSPRSELGGGLLATLPWLVAGVGLLTTLSGAVLTDRLLRRRDDAVRLAQENQELYRAQRTVAVALQDSLLPASLPRVEGIELSGRYESGTAGLEVGGDWYDVMPVPGRRLLFVVGDVSGRGLSAATMMAALRYSVEAYGAQGDRPGAILNKLSGLVSIEKQRHFATVVCGLIDLERGTVTLANAGHPQPLVAVAGGGAEFLNVPVGVPIGVRVDAEYPETTLTIAPGATLLAFTDGLFERRGEGIDAGLERLRSVVVQLEGRSLDDELAELLHRLVPRGAEDDTAILGIRWAEPATAAREAHTGDQVPVTTA
jgi:hypothetical protein